MIASVAPFDADESDALPYQRLDGAQAQAWRKQHPVLSPWRVIGWQVLVGLLVALLAWAVTGRAAAGLSAAYGALVVVLPAMLFARGLMSRFSSINAVTASFGFFIWEAAKIAVSLVLLFAANRVLVNLEWLAMLIGLVVTLKVYGLALLMRPQRLTD